MKLTTQWDGNTAYYQDANKAISAVDVDTMAAEENAARSAEAAR